MFRSRHLIVPVSKINDRPSPQASAITHGVGSPLAKASSPLRTETTSQVPVSSVDYVNEIVYTAQPKIEPKAEVVHVRPVAVKSQSRTVHIVSSEKKTKENKDYDSSTTGRLQSEKVVDEQVFIPTPVGKVENEQVFIPTPIGKVENEQVFIPAVVGKLANERVFIATVEPKKLEERVYIPQPLPPAEVPQVKTEDPIPKSTFAGAAKDDGLSTFGKNPSAADGSSVLPISDNNITGSFQGATSSTPATTSSKCSWILRIVAGLIITLLLIAAVGVPILVGPIPSDETTTTTTTTSTSSETTTTITTTTSSATTTTTTTSTSSETTTTTTTTTSSATTTTTTTSTSSETTITSTTTTSSATTTTITTATTSTTTTTTTSTTSTSTTSTSTTSTTSTTTTSTTSTTTSTSSTSSTSSTTSTSTSTTSTSSTSTSSTTSTSTTTTDTTTTTTTTTTSVSMFDGVKENQDISMSYGWSLCYNGTYDIVLNATLLNTILINCNKSKLLLGCRLINTTLLILSAMGNREDVLFDCGHAPTCTRVGDNVAWYYSSDYSWGFAPATSAVNRLSCDTDSSTTLASESNLRLCWHTGPNAGGYRCGSRVGLNNDTTYERVIYEAD